MKDAPNLHALVSEDYHKTGRCNVAFAKEPHGMMFTGIHNENTERYE